MSENRLDHGLQVVIDNNPYIFEYTTVDCYSRWLRFPKEGRESINVPEDSFVCMGQERQVRSASVPEDAGTVNRCFLPGEDTSADNVWYSSNNRRSHARHILAIFLWGKKHNLNIKFIRRDDEHRPIVNRDEEDYMELVALNTLYHGRAEPVWLCPHCCEERPLSQFDIIEDKSLICAKCASKLKRCSKCGSIYTGEYCERCYTPEACAFCNNPVTTVKVNHLGDIPLSFRRRLDSGLQLPVCEKHYNCNIITEKSYLWKPSAYSFRHMGK